MLNYMLNKANAMLGAIVALLNALAVGVATVAKEVRDVGLLCIPLLCSLCRESEDADHATCGRCVDCAITAQSTDLRTVKAVRSALVLFALLGLTLFSLAVVRFFGDSHLPVILNGDGLVSALSALGFATLRTRQPYSEVAKTTAKNLAAEGLNGKLRRVANGRSKACPECGKRCSGPDESYSGVGDEVINVDGTFLCVDCAVRMYSEHMVHKNTMSSFTGGHTTVKPQKPEPVADPEPVKVPNTAAPHGVSVPTVAPDVAKATEALLTAISAQGAPIDEDAVRRIAQDVAGAEAVATLAAVGAQMEQTTAQCRELLAEAIAGLNQTHTIQAAPTAPQSAFSAPQIVHGRFAEIMVRARRFTTDAPARNVMLIGPAGTGKTHVAQQVHEARIAAGIIPEDAPCIVLNINGDMLAADLLGSSTVGLGKHEPRFIRGGLLGTADVPAFDVPCTVVLDEMDRAEAGTMVALNAALANGFVTTPDGERIIRHPEALVIGTANTRGNGAQNGYAAAQKQDAALIDRFAGRKVDVDFCPGIEAAVAPTVADGVRKMRAVAEAQNMRGVTFSYRAMMSAEGFVRAGIPADLALRWLAEDFGGDVADRMEQAEAFGPAPDFDFNAAAGLNPAGAA